MFLFENDLSGTTQTIRGVRYITISVYGGEKDIFQKVGGLIKTDFSTAKIDKITKESLVDDGIAIA